MRGKKIAYTETLKRVAPRVRLSSLDPIDIPSPKVLPQIAPSIKKTPQPLVLNHPQKSSGETSPVSVCGNLIGGSQLTLIAGPGYVETALQMASIGASLQKLGVNFIRAKAFRQDVWSTEFQGLGIQGLHMLKATAERFGLAVVSELVDIKNLKTMLEYCDVVEVGPRNSHNYQWLRELGSCNTTIILHRGPLMSVNDLLGAIAQVEKGGRARIILAESGIRAFDPRLKNLLDLSSIIHFKKETPYPVFVDCSAAASHARYVEAIAIAAISAGADGVMAEVHPTPKDSFVETERALLPNELHVMLSRLQAMKHTLNAFIHSSCEEEGEDELSECRENSR